jgi:hypothetical protein
MKTDAMRNIIQTLKINFKLNEMDALEFYAREGDWQTQDYYKEVKSLHAWEIDKIFEENLKRNLPGAHIRIGDSYQFARLEEFQNKFDFIVLDNPQNVFGNKAEHFEALSLIPNLLKKFKDCILIFNINTSPFNYTSQTEWIKRRNEYYGLSDTSNISIQYMKNFYKTQLQNLGLEVKDIFVESRDPKYLHYLVSVIKTRQ